MSDIATYSYDAQGGRFQKVAGDVTKTYYQDGLTTKQYDEDIELYYFNSRWYSPSTGQFVSDAAYPIYAEAPYSFCKNDPVNMTDINGQWPEYLTPWSREFILNPLHLNPFTHAARDGLTGLASGALHHASLGIIPTFHDPCNKYQNWGNKVGVTAGIAVDIGSGFAGGKLAAKAGRHALGKAKELVHIPPAANLDALVPRGGKLWDVLIDHGSAIPMGSGHTLLDAAGQIPSRIAIPLGGALAAGGGIAAGLGAAELGGSLGAGNECGR